MQTQETSLNCQLKLKHTTRYTLNSIPNDKILGRIKLKTLEDDEIHVTEKMKIVMGRVKTIARKYWLPGSLKLRIMW